MNADIVFVTGATGNVGRPLVDEVLARGAGVRALTRDPSGANLPPATEVVAADSADPDAFSGALEGATALFMNPAAVGDSTQALLGAAKKQGVRRVVLLSSSAVSDGEEQVYWLGKRHKQLELMVEASGLEWTFLRCGGFATNLLSWASQIRAGDVVRGPYSEAATAPISERDIAATAARVLLDDGHAGATYVLTGQESLTQIEQAKLIGKAIGRELRFQEIPPELFRKQAVAYLPAPAVDDLLRRYAQAVGRVATISPDIERILGRPAATFSDWAVEHAGDFK